MSKLRLSVIVFALVFLFTACGGSNKSAVPEQSAQGNPKPSQEEKKTDEKKAFSTKELWEGCKIVTEEFPPDTYLDTKDGQVKGILTDVVRSALKELNADIPITIHDWTEAYDMTLNGENVFIFAMCRTKERENQFKWISRLGANDITVYSPAKRNYQITSINDLKNYKIATVADDVAEESIMEQGIKDNLVRAESQESAIEKVVKGQADLLITALSDEGIENILKEKNLTKALKKILTLDDLRSAYYIATGLKTSDEKVNLMRKAFEKVQNSQTKEIKLSPIMVGENKYLPARSVYEDLGFNVEWVDPASSVKISNNFNSILVTIDKDIAIVNNKQVKLPYPPILFNQTTTMIPLDFITEGTNAKLEQISNSSLVKITRPPVS